MSDIAIGVIGTGRMGTRHALNLHQHVVGARVAGVYDLDIARATKVGADCGGARAFANPQALITDKKIDAILIASPDPTHADVAQRWRSCHD